MDPAAAPPEARLVRSDPSALSTGVGHHGRAVGPRVSRGGAPVFWAAALWLALVVAIADIGLHALWSALDELPATYTRLRSAGVPASARVVECRPGLGGGRGTACRLALTFDGRTTAWVYPEDAGQFEHLPPGASVAMLVDPADPQVAYTVRDVEEGTNAGCGPVAYFGIGCVAAAMALAVFTARLAIRLGMLRPRGRAFA